ncbi:MAG: hypothetical protein ACP5JG_18720 [Anaerolineae bacterium]
MALLLLFTGWQVAATWQLRAYVVAHPSTGGYGIPLRYTRQAAQRAGASARDGEVIVLSRETKPFLDETPTVFEALLFRVPHRFADPRTALPFPERERVIYLEGPVHDAAAAEPQAAARRLMQLPSAEALRDVELEDGTAYHIYLWESEDRGELLNGMTPLGGGIPFANNVVFAAYEIQPDGPKAADFEVWLAWWLRAGVSGDADYHFTAQLLDESGGLFSQGDHAGFPSAYWLPGDLVLSRFALSPPEDPPDGVYRLRAGMYTYPEIQAVPVVNAEGEPIDDGVTLQEIVLAER